MKQLLVTFAGAPQIAKPANPQQYAEQCSAIRRVYCTVNQFAEAISKGQAWFGCVFSTIDDENERAYVNAWQYQSLLALDFDNKKGEAYCMSAALSDARKAGFVPLVAYETFSSSSARPRFRLVWPVESLLLPNSKPWLAKANWLNKAVFGGKADKYATSPLKLWQGTNKHVYIFHNEHHTLYANHT